MAETSARSAILEAAAIEFAGRGLTGVRVEHVAKRAGCNKALVYRYFGDRDGLFEAVLGRAFRKRHALMSEMPPSLAEGLVAWYRANEHDHAFLRLIQREALDWDAETQPVEAEFRRDYYQTQIAGLAALLKPPGSAAASNDEDSSTRFLFLGLLALTVFPHMFPQLCALVTDHSADSKSFKNGWTQLLRQIAQALGPQSSTARAPTQAS